DLLLRLGDGLHGGYAESRRFDHQGGASMTTKAELHELVEALPDALTGEAARRLADLQEVRQLAAALKSRLSFDQLAELVAWLQEDLDPLERALLTAPFDDEPETDEERAAVAEAREDIAAGRVMSGAELRRSPAAQSA
ncbi:MAG: hypothetical protein ACYDCQ_13025, partial [Dehalococcoidia bacterium]